METLSVLNSISDAATHLYVQTLKADMRVIEIARGPSSNYYPTDLM